MAKESKMNQQEISLGAWDSDTLDKVLVRFINELLQNLSLPSSAPQRKLFTSKDLLSLTPAQFREIVGFIFQERCPSRLRAALAKRDSKLEKLDSFNDLYKDFHVSFDTEPIALYRALKSLFPPDLDLLRPSVILNPSEDSLRTRKVLRYLTGLVLYVDGNYEEFEEVNNQVITECIERNALIKKLDDLRTEINHKVIEQDSWKTQKETMKLESQNKKLEIEKLERFTADLEERVQKESYTYNQLVDKKNAASRELEAVLQEIEKTSNLVVKSPERILEDMKAEKLKLLHLNQHKESCSQKMQEISRESARVAAVTEGAAKAISFYDELVRLMQETLDAKNSWTESQASVPLKCQQIEELKMKIENLIVSPAAPFDSTIQIRDLKKLLESLEIQYEDHDRYFNELQEDLSEIKGQSENLSALLRQKQNKAAKLESSVKDYEEYILVELPQKRAEFEELIHSTLQTLKQEFTPGISHDHTS